MDRNGISAPRATEQLSSILAAAQNSSLLWRYLQAEEDEHGLIEAQNILFI
jgi:hypothetical protein